MTDSPLSPNPVPGTVQLARPPEVSPDTAPSLSLPRRLFRALAVPILAVFTAVIIGSVFILLAGFDPFLAFGGLLQGALGSDVAITRTLLKMTPLILSGLAVALAFKGGLFNIGAQGQLVIGSLCAAIMGYAVYGLPPLLHVGLCLLAGVLGGAAWGFLPGFLKARTGAHEVITTIMLNYIAVLFVEWAVAPGRPNSLPGPFAFCLTQGQCESNPNRTPPLLESAYLPPIYVPGGRNPSEYLHLGVIVAVIVAILVGILLFKTTFGFELRMVGLNPNAARYAGIKVGRMTIITMVLAGALAGLAGAIQVTGVNHDFQTNQNLATGFDSIAVALLAGSNPVGIIPSAFLFGALDAGTTQMQFASRVSGELIRVMQALILMFVAADQIIRGLYRIKGGTSEGKITLSSTWGQR
ncbi:MAG TPA: ABC transporter permease [Aggregatilineales bacterium]|nr:ABC transporter permease [Anaerolineales bacterium]HRE48864.1 ABC transporter permease [Aggregatilineales bacterium]